MYINELKSQFHIDYLINKLQEIGVMYPAGSQTHWVRGHPTNLAA